MPKISIGSNVQYNYYVEEYNKHEVMPAIVEYIHENELVVDLIAWINGRWEFVDHVIHFEIKDDKNFYVKHSGSFWIEIK